MDNLRFYFVTWNVATKNPGQDLNSLLDFPSQFNKNKPLPDFYVIGLQEVKSQPQNMVMDTLFTDPWTSTFNKILCRQGFIIAKSMRLQGILLLVYTQMKHITHLRDIEAQYTKTGLGGLWGNKGAVSVRFNLYGCSICLVNCHLTAHEHLLADRVNDYNTILKQHYYHVSETSNILYHEFTVPKQVAIFFVHVLVLKMTLAMRHICLMDVPLKSLVKLAPNYVFWIGDLNFRTDHPTGASPTAEEIVATLSIVEKDQYSSLLKHDQLLAVMENGDAFSEFVEPEIKFPPTYKFAIGGDEYDVKRKPSWTDRILYKVIANNYENITLRADLISYNHLPHYTVSDHKPVVAQYKIKVRSNVPCKKIEITHPLCLHFCKASYAFADVDVTDGPNETQGEEKIVSIENIIVSASVDDGKVRSGFTLSTLNSPPASRAAIRMRSAVVMPTNEEGTTAVPFVSLGGSTSADGQVQICHATTQAFSNYTEKTVEFAPVNRIWYIGDADFRTQCTLSHDVEVNANDWIGIYDANFHSLDDYIAYEYLAKVSLPTAPAAPGQPRVVTLSFPVGSGVRIPGFYRFIYFSQPNNDVRSVLGISEPFEVSSKEDRLVAIDPCEEPSSSTSPARSKPSTATTDIFTDFSGLDVAKLSRHFSNDLSID